MASQANVQNSTLVAFLAEGTNSNSIVEYQLTGIWDYIGSEFILSPYTLVRTECSLCLAPPWLALHDPPLIDCPSLFLSNCSPPHGLRP